MNIGIFTDTYFPQINGVVYTIKSWKDKLSEKHNVFIYYPKGDYNPQENEFPFFSINFKQYKEYKIALPMSIPETIKNLDIVHIHGLFSMALFGIYVSKKYKIPRIITYHTNVDKCVMYLTKNKAFQKYLIKLYNIWENKILNSCPIVTVPSNPTKEKLLKNNVKNIEIITNGVDTCFFKPSDCSELKTKMKVTSKKVIGFCGRIGYEKHLEDLIKISDMFDGEILIVGRGPAKKHLMKLSEKKSNIKFFDFLERDELPKFYSLLDFFIFPSNFETQGLTALESMSCGTPVIGAKEFGLKETIKEGINGYLYKQGDIKELFDVINKAYKNKKELSNKCIETVKEHSLYKTIKKLEKIYGKLKKL